jgi:VWFA-related protein
MKIKLFIFLSLAGLMILNSSGPRIFSQERQANIRTEVDLVNVLFTVSDSHGQLIHGLKETDFQIFEDKKPQKIDFFSELGKETSLPLTIALIIDTSGSVKDKLDFEKETASEFFNEILRPKKDLALIIQFDAEVNLVQDFTQDPKVLLRALNTLKAGNATSLYDAVYLAAEEKLKNEIGRKVMVVITDGEDNKSKVKKEEAIEAAQKANAVIYGIGVQGSEGTNFFVLKSFAKETGGAFFSPQSKFTEIQAAFKSIGREIDGQYSLGYVSTNTKKDGTYRAIDLRCKSSGVKMKVRKGYYARKTAADRQ